VVGKGPDGRDRTEGSDAPVDRNGVEEFCRSQQHKKYCESGQIRALYLHENESLGPAYSKWKRTAQQYKLGSKKAEQELPEITCTTGDGREVNVVVTGGFMLRDYFRQLSPKMTHSSPPALRQWAANLGATAAEKNNFVQLAQSPQIRNRNSNQSGTLSNDLFDYALALMIKAGFLKFQPWIARDVELLLKTFDLPLGEEYTAIHVRRGDKLIEEARPFVTRYYQSRGHTDLNNLPTNYIPFVHYLERWDDGTSANCQSKSSHEGQAASSIIHHVYIATDDPVTVQEEIASLPQVQHVSPNTIRWNDCHELRFYFNPTDGKAFHLNGDGEQGFQPNHQEAAREENCSARYQRNIVSIADMMILTKARVFIGEFNSNWGRFIRTMRVRLDGDAGLTKVLDTRIAWGPTSARAPGF